MNQTPLEYASSQQNSRDPTDDKYFKRDFWAVENLNYSKPHFRMEKAAGLLNRIAGEKQSDLLDDGCGPAALKPLLSKNIRYCGIDIAIHESRADLMQVDFVEHRIGFGQKKFDLIIAQGVFEYIGKVQEQKFSEIVGLLRPAGTFLVSYVNFNHVNCLRYAPYNNMMPFDEFRHSLERFFKIRRIVPTSHNWRHQEPDRKPWKMLQMHLNQRVPLLSRRLAVENFFICSGPVSGLSRDAK
jgi:SAM-dependent methyltransferase